MMKATSGHLREQTNGNNWNSFIVEEQKRRVGETVIRTVEIPLNSNLEKEMFAKYIGDSYGEKSGFVYYLKPLKSKA